MFGPADHPRCPDAVERSAVWIQELLEEFVDCDPNDGTYVSPPIWIKRTLPYVSLHCNMTLSSCCVVASPGRLYTPWCSYGKRLNKAVA